MAQITQPLQNPLDTARESFNINNIEAKTELTSRQIEAVNKTLSHCELSGCAFLNNHVKNFLVLQKSKDRKSMAEAIEFIKNKADDSINVIKNKLSWAGE